MFVLVPLNEVSVSTTTKGYPLAGEQFMVLCTVKLPEGLTNPVIIEWHDSTGILLEDEETTFSYDFDSETNVTSVLEFEPFRRVHGDRFACTATITSWAPPFNISKTSEVDIVVGGMIPL